MVKSPWGNISPNPGTDLQRLDDVPSPPEMVVERCKTTQRIRYTKVFQDLASNFQRLDLGRQRVSDVDASASRVVRHVSRDHCPTGWSLSLKALDPVFQIRVPCFAIYRKPPLKRYLNRKLRWRKRLWIDCSNSSCQDRSS